MSSQSTPDPKQPRRLKRPGASPKHLSLNGESNALGGWENVVGKLVNKPRPPEGWGDRPRRVYKKKPKPDGSGSS